jgi:hypothetical protein
MKTLISTIFILLFVFSSCEKENNNTGDALAAFPFLKEGHIWHFWLTTSENPSGNEVNYRILSVKDNGYIEVELEFVDLITDNIYWYVDENGFSDIASPEETGKLILLKTNPTLNDTWSSTVNDEGKMVTVTRTVIALNDSVQLPDKSYIKNCVKVHETMTSYPQYYQDIWVSKNDGIVRREGKGYYQEDDGPPVYFDLAYVLISKSF